MDFTNSRNSGKTSGSGRSQDFTNRNNSGMGGGATKKNAPDLTNAGYGAKAPRSEPFQKVVKNKPLGGQFRGSDSVVTTPRTLNVPGFKRRGA